MFYHIVLVSPNNSFFISLSNFLRNQQREKLFLRFRGHTELEEGHVETTGLEQHAYFSTRKFFYFTGFDRSKVVDVHFIEFVLNRINSSNFSSKWKIASFA